MSDQPGLFLPTVIDPVGEEGLVTLRKRCQDCRRCELGKTRTQAVFGEGNADEPDICFIGEAPGAHEDEVGRPFIGRAGQYLMKMIKAMGYAREEVYLCNAVACRPPDNRPPEKGEMEACNDYVIGQVRAVRPKAIVVLGASAYSALFGGKKKITEVRGKWQTFEGIPTLATYHPSYVIRMERDPTHLDIKKTVWGDLQMVMSKVGKRYEIPG